MTVRLLRAFNGIASNSIVTLDPATETALVADNAASTNLAGGVLYQNNLTFEPTVFMRQSIAVGIIGQSNERGQVQNSDATTYPQAFASTINSGLRAPIWGTNGLNSFPYQANGSPWFKFYDDLWNWGYDTTIVNGAIGSLALLRDVCGQVQARANSTAYRALRTAYAGTGDMGYFGDLTVQSSKIFQCTTGSTVAAFYDSQVRAPNVTSGPPGFQTVRTLTSLSSAGADPGTWAAAGLGATVTDGSLTWTNIDDTNSVGYTNGQIFSENSTGLGFDPFAVLLRLHLQMQMVQATRKIILISNGPGDAGISSANYSTVLQNISNYFLRRGYEVAIGLSCYSSSTTTANYNNMSSGVTSALSALSSNSRVYAGANQYALMGSTGPMLASGTYMQSDGTHLTGAGAIVYGENEANAFKAFLPRLTS